MMAYDVYNDIKYYDIAIDKGYKGFSIIKKIAIHGIVLS